MQFALGFTYFQELQFSYLKGVSNDCLLEVLYDLSVLLVLMSEGYYLFTSERDLFAFSSRRYGCFTHPHYSHGCQKGS